MASYALEGPHWLTNAAAGQAVTWSMDATVPAFMQADLISAFAAWSAEANIAFRQVGTGGNITIGLSALDGPGNVLGVTAYIYSGQALNAAHIAFDTAETWSASPNGVTSSQGAKFALVAEHEIGHAIGLDHYNAEPAVMNSVVDSSISGLTASDIAGAVSLYGAHAASVPATPTVAPSPAQQATAVAPSPAQHAAAVFRFAEKTTGEHFYTTSVVERDYIRQNMSNFVYEGAPWAAPEQSAQTQDVFRFYDSTTKTHFYTTSAEERDGILQKLPSFTLEGVAFQAYRDDASPGDSLVLERFFNTKTGQHHFALPDEADGIRHGAVGPNWVDEGPGIKVAHMTADLLV